MAAAPIEAQRRRTPSDAPPAAYPRWVMFEQRVVIESEGSTSGGASKTVATARTSTGHLIQISLRLTEPPGVSCVCLQIPCGLAANRSRVVAAHGDSILIEVLHSYTTTDYFVYSAGAAAAEPPRPPTMSLLPPSRLGYATALVRRGEDDVVVAQLETVVAGQDTLELMREADLSVFRSGEWSTKRLQICFRDASEVPQGPIMWHSVVPVGDRLLCCVDHWKIGVVLYDMFEETPCRRPQYLPLPRDNIWGLPTNRNVCATGGDDALKFVNIFRRCCCGGAGASSCKRSCHAYTIETWTMRMGNDDMEWVKDAMVDASELWALDSYKGLRHFPLYFPVVSLDEPEVICFWLHQPPEDGYRDRRVDVLMVNTRSKTIHSVSRYEGLFPSIASQFFSSYLGSGSDATFTGQSQEDIQRPQPVIIDAQLIREQGQQSKKICFAR